MSDDRTRDEVEEIVNDEPGQEPVQAAAIGTIIEEGIKPVKAKSKAKAKATTKVKITKEPVEPITEEMIKEQIHIKEEPPKEKDKNKEMVQCPDCNLSMTQHTLKQIHKKTRIL